MESNIVLGMTIYTLYVALSTVIITLPVIPIWPVAIYLYGFWVAMLLTLMGTFLGASICFWIARKYGRPLVVKMMGKKLYKEIEHLAHIDSPKRFFLIRLFANNYFDAISYIAGLSKLSFKSYISITMFIAFLWVVGLFYLIQRAGGLENIKSFLTIMTGYAVLVLICTIVWEVFQKRHHKLNKKVKRSTKRKR